MTIRIYNNNFKKCRTGISAPKDSDMEIGANFFEICETAIDIKNPTDLLVKLGLRSDTPISKVKEVLSVLEKGHIEPDVIKSHVTRLGLGDYLFGLASVGTLVQTFILIESSGFLSHFLDCLRGAFSNEK